MLDKKYNHKQVEQGKYQAWKERNYFQSGNVHKTPYTIVLPPPNVTGKLHLGHAWDTTLQDILIRYKRMDGYDALWLPGMDHAGIATQAKVDKRLKEQGIHPRSLTREEWLHHAWAWKEEYANNIYDQWAKLGLSLDYSKERFTLDKGLSDAVKYVFKTLYDKGLIYRGERMINWDPEAMTALSNEEVIYKEEEGAFYHLKYYLEDLEHYLEIATTRPETLFGDTAVAVNPNDERYRELIGKKVLLPIVNQWIPIIGDGHADPEFGTGVVKITPAHDPNDYEVGLRHQLKQVVVINPDGTMNENALQFQGLDRYECRKQLVEELKKQGLLIKEEKMIHSVGHSERTDAVIEPYLSKQWFVKMRPLADRVLANQKTEGKVNFVPERYEKTMNHWMEITYDWCISRQLWWGHQIPAWYRGEEVYVGMNPPEGEGWVQDPDVLDTWFSSALWPFATLGFPNETEDYKRYYPNNVLVTGYDIIPFWVNRMTFQGLEFTGKRPFKDCLIHGLIRDKEGRKMSRSLGNGVDPMDVIEKYGCDALRFFLATSTAPGMDLRYEEEKVASNWNFINKLWNASRFVLMQVEEFEELPLEQEALSLSDQWILKKCNDLIKKVRIHMEQYEFHVVGTELYNFIWNDYCDWYIEFSKINPTMTTKNVLVTILTTILKLLHPFMPYVTEEIYLKLPVHEETIVLSSYPVPNEEWNFDVSKVEEWMEFITKVRTYRLENKIPSSAQFYFEGSKLVFHMLRLKPEFQLEVRPEQYQNSVVLGEEAIYFVYDHEENRKKELEFLKKEQIRLRASIERRATLLANSSYLEKAPLHLIEQTKKTLEKEQAELKQVEERLNH